MSSRHRFRRALGQVGGMDPLHPGRFLRRSRHRPEPGAPALALERLYKDQPSCEVSTEELLKADRLEEQEHACNHHQAWRRTRMVQACIYHRPERQADGPGRLRRIPPADQRPVATPETFDQVVADMKAAAGRRKGRPRTLPFEPDRYPKIGEQRSQNLGSRGPQKLGSAHLFEAGRH